MAGGDLTVLSSMTMPRNSVLLDSAMYSAVGFHLGTRLIWLSFTGFPAANGSQGLRGMDAEYLMRSLIPPWFRWTTYFAVLLYAQSTIGWRKGPIILWTVSIRIFSSERTAAEFIVSHNLLFQTMY
jgi:hypothetical protein